MSPEWFAAAEKMLLEECKAFDIIITTALIPGRKAPVLIKKVFLTALSVFLNTIFLFHMHNLTLCIPCRVWSRPCLLVA